MDAARDQGPSVQGDGEEMKYEEGPEEEELQTSINLCIGSHASAQLIHFIPTSMGLLDMFV